MDYKTKEKVIKAITDSKNEASFLFDKLIAKVESIALKNIDFEQPDLSKPPF